MREIRQKVTDEIENEHQLSLPERAPCLVIEHPDVAVDRGLLGGQGAAPLLCHDVVLALHLLGLRRDQLEALGGVVQPPPQHGHLVHQIRPRVLLKVVHVRHRREVHDHVAVVVVALDALLRLLDVHFLGRHPVEERPQVVVELLVDEPRPHHARHVVRPKGALALLHGPLPPEEQREDPRVDLGALYRNPVRTQVLKEDALPHEVQQPAVGLFWISCSHDLVGNVLQNAVLFLLIGALRPEAEHPAEAGELRGVVHTQ